MYLRGSFNTRKSNMDNNKLKNPAYLFEVSWEVCNKVGGIHTVISTKALNMEKEYSSSHILIGPDVWRYTEQNPEFIDDPRLFRSWRQRAAQEGLRIKVGRWNVAGKPIVILVDFSTFITQKDEIFKDEDDVIPYINSSRLVVNGITSNRPCSDMQQGK